MTIDRYHDNLYVRVREPRNITRTFFGVDDHQHSRDVKDCVTYKVVCCYQRVHLSIKIIACCLAQAEFWAFHTMLEKTGLDVDVAEIWSPYLENEPEQSNYPELHEHCRVQGEVQ